MNTCENNLTPSLSVKSDSSALNPASSNIDSENRIVRFAKYALSYINKKIKLMASRNPSLPHAENEQSQRTSPVKFMRQHFLFFLTVVFPTLASIIYFVFLASDIYVSESSFVVRNPSQKNGGQSGMSSLLQGASGVGSSGGLAGLAGLSRDSEDVHTVADFIESKDALRQLDNKLNVKKWWSASSVDILQRFDPLGWGGWYSSLESLLEYYPRRIFVLVDNKSSIISLTVTSFSPEQALSINSLLLSKAEDLVNALNNRARSDLIRFAQSEVQLAEDKAKATAKALADFRNHQAVVDPEKQTAIHFEQIARLQEELVQIRSQLAQLNAFAPDSPHPPALKLRADTLEREIVAETEKITGGNNSLATKSSEYQRLQLEREFANRQLAVAMTSLETARNEAHRQQLYLETINKPDAPEYAAYPKRFRGVCTTLLLGLIAWGILAILIAGIREHKM